MDLKGVARNASVAFVAQVISFAVSAVVTLLVPKILSVENFGYWQLFVFYSTYVGFFMLGLNDGCYLLNGGKRRDEIDKPSIKSQFFIGLAFEVVLGIALAICVVGSNLEESRSFVLYCICAFIMLRCSAAFLGYLFQAMNETKLYSVSCILERVVFLVAVIAFLVGGVDDFRFYVLAFCFSTLCQFLYCCFHARDILRSGLLPPRLAFSQALQSIRVGIQLMMANIASMLILGIARAVIDAEWGISSFGQLSLALTLCNFFLAFVSQFAMVLFPALRQSSLDEVKLVIAHTRDFLSLFMPVTYLLLFPLYIVCIIWLPQYEFGLDYLAVVLPICVFDSKTNLCCFTYFKVARMETRMLVINLVTVLFSSAGVFMGVFVFDSVDAVILSVVVSIIARSIYCEWEVAKALGLTTRPLMTIGELVITTVLIVGHYFLDISFAFALCAVAYVAFLALNGREVKRLFVSVANKTRRMALNSSSLNMKAKGSSDE